MALFNTTAQKRSRNWQIMLLCLAVPMFAGGFHGKADAMSEVRCDIRSRDLVSGLEVEGIAWSREAIAGHYEFVVNKQGRHGNSHIVQKNTFRLAADELRILGTVSFNRAEGDRYVVDLTVKVDGQQTSCSRTLT